MIDYLKEQNVDPKIISLLEDYRRRNNVVNNDRIDIPEFKYYGKDVLEEVITAILAGKNVLLTGAKATGKNVLASNLSYIFGRPSWNVSFHINTDYSSLIGADTFRDGQVVFRKGPIYEAAVNGGFAILDEINMAKNEAMAVLHASLDYRRVIDVSGYESIKLNPATRFIATMNYAYQGTRDLNEALLSRFVVIQMPTITESNLAKLLKKQYPKMNRKYLDQIILFFFDLKRKSENGEVSDNSVDLRGIFDAIDLVEEGISLDNALVLTISNKLFDSFERDLINDLIAARFGKKSYANDVFS